MSFEGVFFQNNLSVNTFQDSEKNRSLFQLSSDILGYLRNSRTMTALSTKRS